MSCFEKQHYKDLKRFAKADGITLVSESYPNERYSGVTVAYSAPIPGRKMVAVSVSYCSNEDEFKPKHGKYQALVKYLKGEYVQLPIGSLSKQEISEFITGMFLV